MKALVDTNTNLVVDVHPTGFEVHPSCVWVDNAPEGCRIGWRYSPDTEVISAPSPKTYSYKHLREFEYPSLQKQLDMQYWDGINGTTVWADTIAAIKAKYPKE